MEQLIQYDTDLFLWLNNLGNPTWDGFWLAVTNKFTFIPLYGVLLYLLYRKMGAKSLLISVVVIAFMIAFTDQISSLFKHGVQRPRPCKEADLMEQMRYIAERCGRYGFFSAHAANSMAIAVFTGLLLRPYYKSLIFALLFWSAFVAYSRIYVGVHYPLDIICGMTFGAMSGFLFYKLKQKADSRFISS
ncbi:phosphatase PAP2 family protein [Mangrovimonas xylaniphaga]|uniref:phosphatase PAP2 family protein n=1 Tax=Mangrovimonas xylaniphaga TaxID=1645915 RepID=UPI0006B461DE|nr:phosphatase PAP2 family protein [Mangrovimonas xylaniphaga]